MLYLIAADKDKRLEYHKVLHKSRVLVKVWENPNIEIVVREEEPHAFLFLDKKSASIVFQNSPSVKCKPCFLLENEKQENEQAIEEIESFVLLPNVKLSNLADLISEHLAKINCSHYIDDYAVAYFHDYRKEKNMKIMGREVHFTPIQRMIIRLLLHVYPYGLPTTELLDICMKPGPKRQLCNIATHVYQINLMVESTFQITFIKVMRNRYYLMLDKSAEIIPPTKLKRTIDVVAALITDDEIKHGPTWFLICQRPEGKPRELFWEFPGGKIEDGETPEQALVRECREELDIGISVGGIFMQVIHEYSDVIIRLAVYRARIMQGIPQCLEHNEIKWITKYDFVHYNFCPADYSILRKYGDLLDNSNMERIRYDIYYSH